MGAAEDRGAAQSRRATGRVPRIAGLDGVVEVARDQIGVPHCYARSEHDAFFAQGFVHVADRLWQMDYDRRRGLGCWAEVAGPNGVVSDTFYRRLDLAASARRDLAVLSPRARAMLEAYTAGVNAGIARLGLPREFAVAEVWPLPWQPWHCLLVHRVRHVTMGSARAKLWRSVVASVLGPHAARQMYATAGVRQVACLPPGQECDPGLPAALGADDAGSNNWVLAGSRTASGLPLLAGDSHRPLEAPNVYVQGHIACPEWDVLGAGMPGVPGFPHFGHNARVAWSITHAMVDDQDLYEVDGVASTEVINVRGGESVRVTAGATPRGPLIGEGLAMAWTATAEPNRGFDAVWAMLRARSVGELFEAMRSWVEPANNLLAADTDGTIGYLTRGRIPVRNRADAAWLPVPGEDQSYGWTGYLAFDSMPRALGAESGFFLSANNQILPSPEPYLSLDFGPPWRAARIAAMLRDMREATVADMEALHGDVVSLPARRLASVLDGWAPLAGWDGSMDVASRAAAAYSTLRRELGLLMLERSGLAACVKHPRNRLLPGIRAESLIWRIAGEHLISGDTRLLGSWSWEKMLGEALSRAEHAWAGASWGELHATRISHPLPRPGFDPPTVPYGGDMDTVQASHYVPGDGLATIGGSVVRYAFDLAEWDRSGWALPLGVAGEPGSPHAYDQQQPWSRAKLLPAPYTRSAVEAAATSGELLEPA